MILTQEHLITIAAKVNSEERKKRRSDDYKKYLLYNGKSKELISDALKKEFKQKTVDELTSRIVTINITKKIINKKAGVYSEPPLRKVTDESKSDAELLGKYEDQLNINLTMKENNRYFELTKRMMTELFLDDEGRPGSRALPSHTYEVFSFSKKNPSKVQVVALIQQDNQNKEAQVIEVWSDQSFYTIDGHGKVIIQGDEYLTPTADRNVNPYGALPFFYKCENTIGVDPIEEDDLLQMAIVIPVILTDLLFGLKYQTFSIIYTVGVKGDIELNPNSVVSLDYDEEGNPGKIETVKAVFDSDKILNVVFNLIELLLSVNNLSSPVTRGSTGASDAVSGISKILDSAESIENKKDKQDFFVSLETELWKFIAQKGAPTWKKTRGFSTDFLKEFSSAFNPTIQHKEPKALISEKERIETLKAKKDLEVILLKDIVRELNPDMDDKALDAYVTLLQEQRSKKSEKPAVVDKEAQNKEEDEDE